jgi:lipopolysaccharide transport system permease protein/teichoic acid transport system permease protein
MHAVNEAPSAFRSSAHRPGPVELLVGATRDIVSRRHLIGYLIGAQVRKKGTDTVLGNVWWILDPLITMMVYVLVMTVIFQRNTPDFPLFLLAAMVPFKWATATIGGSTGAVVSQERLIKQILFPKIILPITTAGAEVVSFLFGMAVLAGVMVVLYPSHLSLMLLWVPVIAVVQFVFTLGIAIMVSAVTVFYRDVGIVIGHFMRLLFWLSPILWSFDAAAGRGKALEEALGETGFHLLAFNPISILLGAYRHVIYGPLMEDPQGVLTWTAPVPPDLVLLGIVLAIGLVLLVLGTLVFKRLEPAFAKVL